MNNTVVQDITGKVLTDDGFRVDYIERIVSALQISNDAITQTFIREMLENCELFARKHHDYGPGNIAAFGSFGVLVRMNDKFERLKKLCLKNGCMKSAEEIQAHNESIEDTMRDISNYATIMILCWRGEWK